MGWKNSPNGWSPFIHKVSAAPHAHHQTRTAIIAEIALQYLQRTKSEWFGFEKDRSAYFALW